MIEGWLTQVWCPHGVSFRLPLRYVYGLEFGWVEAAGEYCEQCKELYAPAPHRTREDRAVDRQFKRMTKGNRRSAWRWLRDLDRGTDGPTD